MDLSRTQTLRLMRIGLMTLLVLVVIVYAIARTLDYARGPVIEVREPAYDTSTTSTVITVRGTAQRIKDLSLNGNPITVDQQGNFSQILTVFPGMNQILLSAHDQFNRSTSREIDVVGLSQISAGQPPVISTSTASTSQI